MGSRIKESPDSTFELYLEVTHPGTEGSGPEVRRQYPEDYSDQETLQTLPRFCFPFIMDSLTVSQVGQNFTFVLTDIESKQRFGFCRLSSGAQNCYCILSYLPWFEVFYKLLNMLADFTIKGQESEWQELLVSLHTLPIPDAGIPVHLSMYTCFTVPNMRELPSIPENRNLTEYFVAVDVNNMLHLYASMLFERRILICCSKLSTLTACIHGSAAMLYPMFWQHVYIPVLPQHLIDYCCAPMPYLIGVHSSLMEKVRGMALDDVVVLNVDTNTLETPFEDLQTLPSDVISSLKNRLKKVSITTGEGVARAFLKSQAALFGSYRNALQIEPGEPITFNEETFMNHRSNTMRQFLHNAIQLQLFKQFVDGRLDLLNSGEGFSDVFEEEINMGEYAGSDKIYHQWLLTVKKGGGALFNTMRTRANPAMKTVYKFAKDHAKMGIKEVRSRLKQKEQAENGYTTAGVAAIDHDGSEQREGMWTTLDHRRPVTVHFGQARPPRPLMMKRPSSNVGLDSNPDLCARPTRHYTVFLSEDSSEDELQRDDPSASGFNETFLFSSFEWSPLPQPYRSLKESGGVGESAEGGDPGLGAEHRTAPPSPTADKLSNVNLLGELFSCQDEPESQPLSLAKSLEDLRTPKELYKFTYQRMDLSANERTCTLPGLKLSHPYNKQWSGQDDMAVPAWASPGWERPPSEPPSGEQQQEAQPPGGGGGGGGEGFGPSPVCPDPSGTPGGGGESNITIPRPQGRKTPEPGKILAPHVTKARTTPTGSWEGRSSAGGHEFRQALGMSPGEDLLKPTRADDDDDLDLLNLLDPLSDAAQAASSSLYEGGESGSSSSASKPALPPRPNLPGLPCLPPYGHTTPLNPFAHGLRTTSPLTHYSPAVGANPFGGVYMSPAGAYFHGPPRPHPPSAALPELYRAYSPSTFSTGFRPLGSPFPPAAAASLPHLSASNHALSALADSPSAPNLAPRKPQKKPEEDSLTAQDFFGDLLTMAKPATPPTKKADNLRRRWETFD